MNERVAESDSIRAANAIPQGLAPFHVLGAGPAGIGCAYALGRRQPGARRVEVLEAAPVAGGLVVPASVFGSLGGVVCANASGAAATMPRTSRPVARVLVWDLVLMAYSCIGWNVVRCHRQFTAPTLTAAP